MRFTVTESSTDAQPMCGRSYYDSSRAIALAIISALVLSVL